MEPEIHEGLQPYVDQFVTGDNQELVQLLPDQSVDLVLTSPPYNQKSSKSSWLYGKCGKDGVPNEQYIEQMVQLFQQLARVLKPQGAILFNLGYTVMCPSLPLQVVLAIEQQTPLRLLDIITWKKPNAHEMGLTKSHLTRVCESIYVFGRSELSQKPRIGQYTHTNKPLSSYSPTNGQPRFSTHGFTNFIEAKCNNGKSCLNAAFSTELVGELLRMYCPPGGVCLDPYMGSGTTAVGCVDFGCHFIGFELEPEFVQYSEDRLRSHSGLGQQ